MQHTLEDIPHNGIAIYAGVTDLPCRWSHDIRTHEDALLDIDRCGRLLAEGVERLSGLYLRICDDIRNHGLTENEIRATLGKHFPPPRVSEFIRVANAAPETYRRYRFGLVGWKATLAECRGYKQTPTKELTRRRIRRCAERLVLLLGRGEVQVRGRRVSVW